MTESTATSYGTHADPPTKAERRPTWRALGWFFIYRLCMASGLLLVFGQPPARLWSGDPLPLVSAVALLYAILVLLSGLFLYAKWPSKEQQVHIAVFLDVVAFTLLLHGSGGVRSGLGLLLAIAVTAGALLMKGRLSLLFASFATLGVIAVHLYGRYDLDYPPGSLTQAGLLGITFFAVAILAYVLRRHIEATERLAARRQVDIADLSQLNEYIIQHMGTGILVVDQAQRVRLTNAAGLQLLGLPATTKGEQLQNVAPELAHWLAAQPPLPGTRPDARGVLSQGRELNLTYRLLGKDATAGAIIFLRDNRELVREAQQIKLASLGRLTASIAHNIRNPLSSVNHAAQLLAESPALGAEDQRLLDIITRNSARIDDIIESVLQLSRRNRAASEQIELGMWLNEFCADLRETKTLGQERLRLSILDSPLTISADPRHLHQILANLCENAISHSGSDGAPVQIEIRAYRDPIRGNRVTEVIDDGPGIDPETAREIFNPFFSTNPGGTGLGLYIAKELAETNGAELEYIAQEKPGTCFRLTFP